jgi:outer membrane protein OmpA-like peptidoglycan-associated protein/Tol biopolymer transport system component
MKHLYIIFFLLSHLLINSGYSQNKLCPPSGEKKALKYFESAKDARKKANNYKEVKEILIKCIDVDSLYSDAWKLLGDAAWFNKDFSTAEKAYSKAIETCADIGPSPYYRLGSLQYKSKKYANAISALQSFLDHAKINEDDAKDATQTIARAQLLMSPVSFDPKPLNAVSTADPEYLACISPDGDYCFFTRRFEMQAKGSLTPVSVEKFMVSKKVNSVFDKGEPMPIPFNRKQTNNEGSPSISIDNRFLFFTQNNDGNFDIYMSKAIGSGWDDPEPVFLDKADNNFWESQPCLSPDGKILYFASYRDSINEQSDIYISEKRNEKWSSPRILEGPINTAGNEKSPFLHPDNKTLYFSSNGIPGMGGFDIYMSKKDSLGNWTTPVNLGYPINTEADEVGFFVSTDGQHGYFASNSLMSKGGYDIFEFPLYQEVRPEKVLFIKGQISDEEGEGLANAKIELRNTVTRETAEISYDSTTGKYASVVLFNEDYILTVKKKGYAYSSAYLSTTDTSLAAPKKIDIQVSETVKGKAYTLNNILFETNSSVMNHQNEIIVEQFADYLSLNPTLKVAIYGHTDDEGNSSDNLILSERRAKAVYDYLISKKIAESRLSYKGFGESNPLLPNNSELNKSKNRRTEFYIESL